ncbi:NAD(P)-dependent dehydrogenase (short-subunit alcohol dehydrogenase family) [Brevibacterium sanguinis]|uniref:NAD(P)-dependent dehydrogenase (Short-subunit alcohol dehydrogenase family) n=2 Tax=Brevibacterium TaxID=1696 RepID=A0A366ILQ5_9MICO|nr:MULTISPECIES: SDR family oxidoreductase [Brevibacterium]RBP65723.1 NAD(P)-dependent dehydrogenase (short-subunit alcohol dehydrogenase family) [Brevibacterium sanguinis]RBP72357.1 NAD(P)-dependent dehydrogenase (short-subunit alcohol dehydrogenase family) [Brevibacterium celere]
MTRPPLEGRKVLVTGASKGIGAEIARSVHRDGAAVVIHYGSDAAAASALAAELGERAHAVGADLSDPTGAEALWSQAVAALGGIDTLVCNAGAWIDSPLDDAERWRSGWAANLQLNLTSAADLCRLALLDFVRGSGSGPSDRAGGGTIITITSRSAHRGDDAEHLAYGAAKAGLLSLTKGIARGYGHLGVLAYAIAPGWVDTGLAAGAISPDVLAGLPLREVTPPEDVAELVAFLASRRSRHLTGATLDVTGADYVR